MTQGTAFSRYGDWAACASRIFAQRPQLKVQNNSPIAADTFAHQAFDLVTLGARSGKHSVQLPVIVDSIEIQGELQQILHDNDLRVEFPFEDLCVVSWGRENKPANHLDVPVNLPEDTSFGVWAIWAATIMSMRPDPIIPEHISIATPALIKQLFFVTLDQFVALGDISTKIFSDMNPPDELEQLEELLSVNGLAADRINEEGRQGLRVHIRRPEDEQATTNLKQTGSAAMHVPQLTHPGSTKIN